MARSEEEEHWLLRRQLNELGEEEIPGVFKRAVNRAYRVFDDNYLRIKLILRRKIFQLVESNARLQELLNEKNNRIDSDQENLKKLLYNLNRAEVIAHLGSFTWYAGVGRAEYSDNLFQLLGLASNPRYFELEAHVSFSANGRIEQISGILKENTRWVHVNNRAEDQKQFYEAILNNIPVDIAIFNQDHKYMYLNPVAVRNQEIRDYMLGRDDFDYCRLRNLDTSKAEARRAVFIKARDTKQVVEFEDIIKNADDTNKYVLRRYVPVLNQNEDFAFMLGYGVDISKIKEQEISLEHSLNEKELLLGEIHHSVKNNLTLIVALLEINSAHEKEELVRKYFNEIRNRISALALIYDKLYRSEVFNLINLREYISALTHSLQQSFLHGRRDVLEIDVDEIYVDNKIAVPLALLINELVSNAFLHAFPKVEVPRLQLSFKRESESVIRLVVADNGLGLPENFDVMKGKTFGFKLISLFTRQLKGKLNVSNIDGLHIDVEFQNLIHEVRN